jgi:nucleoside-diphosphate-sugar epimerase
MCEQLAGQFSRSFGIECVGLRYFNIFGPRQRPDGPYAAVVPRFFAAALSGEDLVIHGDGEQSRDFTPVAQAVRANLLAAEAPEIDSELGYNIATGNRITINEIARAVSKLSGSASRLRYDPPRAGDVRHSLAELSRSTRDLGYAPTTSLEDGLAACLDYYRSLST